MTASTRTWFGRRVPPPAEWLGTSGSFRRNALVLTAGTFTAQALPLLLYPVFTRMFAPADFGVFATVSLFATVVALIASGAYEQAILIASSRRAASHVVGYALLRSGLLLALLSVVTLAFGDRAALLGVEPTVIPWLPSVPVMAAALVVYNCYSEWCVRSKYFAELSKLRMWQTSAIAGARLAFGLAWPTANGFVAGDLLGKIASVARSAAMAWQRDRPYVLIQSVGRVREAARRYARVARFALPDQLINTLSGSIHVLFLGKAFGADELGYVTLVLSLMYVPVTVVSSAVKDVFRQRANVEYRTTGTCRPTYRRLLLPITGLGALGFGTLYLISPSLFPLVLGAEWGVAGTYARILIPLFFCNFVSMSLGGVLVIAERTDVSLVWQVTNLALTVGSLIIGTQWVDGIAAALWCFSIGRALAYLLYMALSYFYAERRSAPASAN
jgi:O-antigen/teichoic acid export membrane protein